MATKRPKITITVEENEITDTIDVGWKFQHEGQEYSARVENHRTLPRPHEREMLSLMTPEQRAPFEADIQESCNVVTIEIVRRSVGDMYRNAVDTFDALVDPDRPEPPTRSTDLAA